MTDAQEHTQAQPTYFIDAENAAEMARLVTQDRLITGCMSGFFPPQLDPANMHDILDVACGPGGWATDVAKAYPGKHVTGIDVSQVMIEFDRYQAAEQKLHNVNFVMMDALKPLAFPDASFDFVNARFLGGFVPGTQWQVLVQEYRRILRPGGVVRLTEPERIISNSAAVERFHDLVAEAMHKGGQSSSPNIHQFGTTPLLGRFLRDNGYQNVQVNAYALDSSWETEAHLNQYQNARVFFKLIQPFFVKTGIATQEEAEALCQRALQEMMSPEYCALWYFLSAWGEKPR